MTPPRKRGFAAMTQEQQRTIASKGGRAAHRKGTAHEFSSEEARKAGYLGGKAVSANRDHMVAIGRKGGQRAGRRLDSQRQAQVSDRNKIQIDVPTLPSLEEQIPEMNDSQADRNSSALPAETDTSWIPPLVPSTSQEN